eukprot:g463.t1
MSFFDLSTFTETLTNVVADVIGDEEYSDYSDEENEDINEIPKTTSSKESESIVKTSISKSLSQSKPSVSTRAVASPLQMSKDKHVIVNSIDMKKNPCIERAEVFEIKTEKTGTEKAKNGKASVVVQEIAAEAIKFEATKSEAIKSSSPFNKAKPKEAKKNAQKMTQQRHVAVEKNEIQKASENSSSHTLQKQSLNNATLRVEKNEIRKVSESSSSHTVQKQGFHHASREEPSLTIESVTTGVVELMQKHGVYVNISEGLESSLEKGLQALDRRLFQTEELAARYRKLKFASVQAVSKQPGAKSAEELIRLDVNALESLLTEAGSVWAVADKERIEERERLLEKISSLQTELQMITGKHDEAIQLERAANAKKMENLENMFEQVKKKCREAYAREEKLICEASALRQEKRSVDQRVSALESELQEVREDADEAEAAAQDAQAQIDCLEEEAEEAEELAAENTELKRQLLQMEAKVSSLETQLNDSIHAGDILRRQISDRNSQLAALNADFKIIKEDETRSSTALHNLEKVLSSFQEERRRETEKFNSKIESLQMELEKSKCKIEDVATTAAINASSNYVNELREKEASLVASRLEIKALRQGLDQAVGRLNKVYFGAEDTLDKYLVQKLLLNYFEQNCASDVLEVCLGILGFSSEQQSFAIKMNEQRNSNFLAGGSNIMSGWFGFGNNPIITDSESSYNYNGPDAVRRTGKQLRNGSGDENGTGFADVWLNFLVSETAGKTKMKMKQTNNYNSSESVQSALSASGGFLNK